MNKVAMSILSLRRWRYLTKLLESMERNVDLDKVDFFLLQDGAVNEHSSMRYANDEDVAESIRIFEASKLPNKIVLRQKHNIGVAGGAMAELFELFGRGYEYVVIMPNDVVVGKYFVKTHLVLNRQFGSDQTIGMARTGVLRTPMHGGEIHTKERAFELENKVVYGIYEMQDLGIWAYCWDKIKEDMAYYRKLVMSCDWRIAIDYSWHGKAKPSAQVIAAEKRFGTAIEDRVIPQCISKQGFKGLHTVVPRINSIGEISVLRHNYRNAWRNFGVYKITLWDIGAVDKYEVIPYSSIQPLPKLLPPKRMMVYKGPETAPFPIRGDKSRKMYYRIYPNKPIEVSPEDMEFFLKNGFVEI